MLNLTENYPLGNFTRPRKHKNRLIDGKTRQISTDTGLTTT